jgi:hypothetical protein
MDRPDQPLKIELTSEQLQLLEPFFSWAALEAQAGRPGMLVAQIGRDERSVMKVAFWEHTRALAVTKALTGKP